MAVLRLEVHDGQLRASGAIDEQRQYGRLDRRTLRDLAHQCRWASAQSGLDAGLADAPGTQERQSALLEVGQAMTAWLEGPTQWATRWVASPSASHAGRGPELEIRVPWDEVQEHWALLDAPWELLAMVDPLAREHSATFIATWAMPLIVYRRLMPPTPKDIGNPGYAPTRPRPRHALTVLFMAAAPEGQSALDYEAEERGILDATRQLPLDLLVQETGTAAELGNRLRALTTASADMQQASPVQVVHLSCHGTLGRDGSNEAPALVLEDSLSRPTPTTAAELSRALACDAAPDLVVLSACLSAAGRRKAGPSDAAPPSSLATSGSVEPIVVELLRSWVPAAIGFADSVADLEASCFAALLYRELAEGQSIETAVAWARQQMVTGVLRHDSPSPVMRVARRRAGSARLPPLLSQPPPSDYASLRHEDATAPSTLRQILAEVTQRGSRHWHLARLMLRIDGGGPIASPHAARRILRRLPQAFLDPEKRISAAGAERYVGRRRELQEIVRVLTVDEAWVPEPGDARPAQAAQASTPDEARGASTPDEARGASTPDEARGLAHDTQGLTPEQTARETPAEARTDTPLRVRGVLIHGLANVGTSSLAARVVQRLVDHRPAVVLDDYSTLGIFNSIRTALGPETPVWLCTSTAEALRTPNELETALKRLLVETGRGGAERPPLLLVLDNLDRHLIADEFGPRRGRYRLAPEVMPVMRAMLRAFGYAESTRARLLITSRFMFTLPDVDGTELANVLRPLPLPGMTEHEAHKHAHAMGHNTERGSMGDRCVRAAQGSPGLLTLLLTIAAESPESCANTLNQLETWIQKGESPTEQVLRTFFEHIDLERILRLLSDGERKLLRASMVFEVPVPILIIPALRDALLLPEGLDWRRLVDLGLWELHRDQVARPISAILPSRLVRPCVVSDSAPGGPLSEQERRLVARAVLPVLMDTWASVNNRGSSSAAYQLFALAMAAGDAGLIARLSWAALGWLSHHHRPPGG